MTSVLDQLERLTDLLRRLRVGTARVTVADGSSPRARA
jgi:hypothetical protein